MTPTEFKRMIKKLGFKPLKGRGKGSHEMWTDGTHTVIIENHKGDIKKGTLNAMLKQVGLK